MIVAGLPRLSRPPSVARLGMLSPITRAQAADHRQVAGALEVMRSPAETYNVAALAKSRRKPSNNDATVKSAGSGLTASDSSLLMSSRAFKSRDIAWMACPCWRTISTAAGSATIQPAALRASRTFFLYVRRCARRCEGFSPRGIPTLKSTSFEAFDEARGERRSPGGGGEEALKASGPR